MLQGRGTRARARPRPARWAWPVIIPPAAARARLGKVLGCPAVAPACLFLPPAEEECWSAAALGRSWRHSVGCARIVGCRELFIDGTM